MLAIRVSRGLKGIAFSLKPVAANARLEGKASNKGVYTFVSFCFALAKGLGRSRRNEKTCHGDLPT